MRLPPHYETALIRALHSTEGAAARWAGANRMEDDALRQRIAEEFGISGGFGMTGERVNYWGGTNPVIEIQIGADAPQCHHIVAFGREVGTRGGSA